MLELGLGARWIERRLEQGRFSAVHRTDSRDGAGGRQGVERRQGIWVHHCKLAPEDCTVRDGFPVTTVARTLFDFAEVAPFDSLKGAAEEADRLKLLRLRELEAVCERGRGRRALRPIRRLLAELESPDEGRSPLEIRFPAFLREHQLPIAVELNLFP